jgi:hypothetical protein
LKRERTQDPWRFEAKSDNNFNLSKDKALETNMTEKKTDAEKITAIRKKVEALEKAMKAIQAEVRKAKVKAS